MPVILSVNSTPEMTCRGPISGAGRQTADTLQEVALYGRLRLPGSAELHSALIVDTAGRIHVDGA